MGYLRRGEEVLDRLRRIGKSFESIKKKERIGEDEIDVKRSWKAKRRCGKVWGSKKVLDKLERIRIGLERQR